MYTKGPALATALAFTASATPINTATTLEARDETFNIHVVNQCHFTKEVAIYQLVDWKMTQVTTPTNINAGRKQVIAAPFRGTGLRLSGHAEWGVDKQWDAQAMFEFGYSTYAGKEGTAYDLSVMSGIDSDIGIGAYPIPNGRSSSKCDSKTCFPWDCPLAQGWTNPDQTKNGSPADTVCYEGKTDFKVVFCP